MKADIQALWADELESGRHTQGAGHLRVVRDGTAYECCLGVLCELAYAAGVVTRVIDEDGVCYYGARKESAVLPYEVRLWGAVNDENPIVDGSSLAVWNDGPVIEGDFPRKSFPEIAVLVRKL